MVTRILKKGKKEGLEKMADTGEVYYCGICGQKVKVVEGGAGTLVCCGEDMELLEGEE